MNTRYFVVLVFCCLLLFSALNSETTAKDQGLSGNEWQQQLLSGWEHLDQLDRMAGEYSAVLHQAMIPANAKGEMHEKYVVRKSNGLAQIEAPRYLYSTNEDYQFTLTRSSPDQGWLFSGRDFARRGEEKQSVLFSGDNHIIAYPLSFISFRANAIELFKSGNLTLQNPRKNPAEQVTVDYSMTMPPDLPAQADVLEAAIEKMKAKLPASKIEEARKNLKIRQQPSIQKGTLTLDPNCHWIVAEKTLSYFSHQPEWKGSFKRTYDPNGGPKSSPRVSQIEIVNSFTVQGIVQRRTITFEDYTTTAFPKKFFYLSNFGIPEPSGVSIGWSRPIIFIAAGGVCLLLMILFRRLYVRSQRGKTAAA